MIVHGSWFIEKRGAGSREQAAGRHKASRQKAGGRRQEAEGRR
jgi:hypothetical protein